MTRADLARALSAIEQTLDSRVEIWVQVVEPDGTLAERIYQGSFQRQPGSQIGEPNQEKRT
jgi:hypothetical protein